MAGGDLSVRVQPRGRDELAQLVTDETDIAAAVGRCLRARGWTDVGTDVPAGLVTRLDRRRFDVILANLIGNALRHGDPPVKVTAAIMPNGHGRQLAAQGARTPRSAQGPMGRLCAVDRSADRWMRLTARPIRRLSQSPPSWG